MRITLNRNTGQEACIRLRRNSLTRLDGRWLIVGALALLTIACATTSENTARNGFKNHDNAFVASGEKEDSDSADKEPDGTLEGYISYAMKNSPELEAQFERWQASIHRISQTRRLPDPIISYAYYISSVETRVGPQRHKLSLKQSFPWPTKLSAGADAASARAQSAERRFDALAISISAAVEEKYWTLWELRETRKVHEEHISVLTSLSQSASAQVMTGRLELADQLQIDLTAARIEDLLSVVDEGTIKAGAGLKGVIGAPQSMEVKVETAPAPPTKVSSEEELLASVKSHPYIYSFEALAQASEAEAEKEEASRLPNFTLGVDWIETGETDMPNVSDSGKDALIVGVGISVPLWQRNYKESVAAHQSDVRAHRADGKAAEDSAVARFYTILSDVRDAKRRIELYEGTLVPQATSVFESVIGSYTTGRGSVASILLAQRDLLDLKVQLISAQADFSRSWARLESIVGLEIKAIDSETKQKDVAQ